MQIRVALLVNKSLSKVAKKLANNFARLSKSFFTVDGKKLAHHITLFDIFPSKGKISRAAKIAENIIQKQPNLKLAVSNLWKSTSGKGYLGLKIKPSKQLLNFRTKLFKILKNYHPQEVGERYSPHITLTRYKDPSFADEVTVKNKIKGNYKFERVIFARVDVHGQVYKILKQFHLS